MNARSGAERRAVALKLTVIAAALAGFGPPALADERDEEIARLTRPDSQVSVGVGAVSDDNTRFGQYSGMVDKKLYLLLDIDMTKREDASGTWTTLQGHNLGLESRDLRFGQQRQGNWGYFIDYSAIPRYSPYTPITRLAGEDSQSQVVNGLPTPRALQMETIRQRVDLGFDKLLPSNFEMQVRARSEEKTGRRLFGRSGVDFLVDPIDYSTQILEATANYTTERLQLSGGFYGTNFVNSKAKLDATGGTGSSFSPIALPPGNQSQQFNLAGGYNFSQTTRATFKAAYTHQTQDEQFMDTPASGVNRSSLGGEVNTLFLQGGITARPIRGLTLLANVRHEDRHDATPIVDYFVVSAPSTATGENEPRSIRTTAAKFEASYPLPWQIRGTAALDYEQKWRNTSSVRVVSYREKTEETALRLEGRRTLAETLNGSLALIVADRGGSDWLTNFQSTPSGGVSTTPGSNLVHPLHLADRHRNKLRATATWTPMERLDLQFVGDVAKDTYGGRTLGLDKGSAAFLSVDGAYRLSDAWQLTAWLSRDDTKADLHSCASAASSNLGDISACPNSPASPIWSANLRNVGNTLGIGVKGRPTGPLQLAADLQISKQRGEFNQGPMPVVTPAVTAVPDVNYSRKILRLSGDYALTKRSGVRAQFIQDRFHTDDYTWAGWTYSDGTTVNPNSDQRVNFIGVSGYYNF